MSSPPPPAGRDQHQGPSPRPYLHEQTPPRRSRLCSSLTRSPDCSRLMCQQAKPGVCLSFSFFFNSRGSFFLFFFFWPEINDVAQNKVSWKQSGGWGSDMSPAPRPSSGSELDNEGMLVRPPRGQGHPLLDHTGSVNREGRLALPRCLCVIMTVAPPTRSRELVTLQNIP